VKAESWTNDLKAKSGVRRAVPIALVFLALGASPSSGLAAPPPVVLHDVSTYAFPEFVTALNATSKGWIFAPPFVGLKWVELNGVLLTGNSATDDPDSGLTFTTTPLPFVVNGFDWEKASQRPARNGICRGGIHGNRNAMGMKLAATPGRSYILEVLALGAAAQRRSMNVLIDGQPVAKNWTVLTDRAANRLLRVQLVADADGIDLQLTPGSVSGTDTNPAITAVALTDVTGGTWSYDPIFGRAPAGLVNIAGLGAATSPDGLEQDGDGRGDQAGIDGDPNTYWDEADGAKLYRYVVTFKEPEKIAALALMGWGQHDFAPKDFEIVCDGKPVRTVENARYTNNVLHLPMSETVATAIELKIAGYYGRSPAIRELGIFSREARPAAPKPAAAAPMQPKDGGPIFAEWPLQYKQQKLLVYALGKFKPYVKELCSPSGRNIFRDAPFDHLHHHSLMYAIKANGVNFWEETPGCGFQKPVETSSWTERKSAEGLPQFVLRQRLHWLAPADVNRADTIDAAILIERRTLTVTVNEAQRETALHWKSEFEVGPKTNQVTLTGANYHGLGMRFLQPLDSFAKHLNSGGAPDLSGNKQDVSQHRWASVSFDPPGQPVTLVLFGHPGNARGDSWFFTMRTPFAYLSATQNLDQEPLVYRRGETFQLNYLVTLCPELKPAAAIDARAGKWANSKP
jgi:hypothetical protein